MVDRIHIFRLSRREESFSFGRKGKRRAGGRERSAGDACVRRVAGAHAAARARRGHRRVPPTRPRVSPASPATPPPHDPTPLTRGPPIDARPTPHRATPPPCVTERQATRPSSPFLFFIYSLSLPPPRTTKNRAEGVTGEAAATTRLLQSNPVQFEVYDPFFPAACSD